MDKVLYYYKLGENGEIIAACSQDNGGYSYAPEGVVLSYDGRLLFKSEVETEEYKAAQTAFEDEKNKENMRLQREQKCFPIINRGKLWYDKLTSEQTLELKNWYQAWLDAPQTGVVPDRPAWLK